MADNAAVQYILVGAVNKSAELGYKKPKGYPGTERSVAVRNGNYLVLLGNDSGNYTGTQYAVTMLLEKLGCGWYGADELWQVVPEAPDIAFSSLELDVTAKYASRNTRVIQNYSELGMRWYEGGIVSLNGHWLPQAVPASMCSTHPEWFAANENGERSISGITYWHYCYSNTELAKYVAQKAIEKFANDPNLISLTITANDGWNENWCTCSECAALGNASDQMVYFANNVARIVAKKYPDRHLHILSYHNTFLPPENDVALEDNVELMLCRESSMTAPLDTDFTFEAGEDRITHVKYTQSWRQNALEYIEKTSAKHVSVWDWYCLSASSEAWKDIPWLQGKTAGRNQDVYSALGAEYVFYDHGPLEAYFEDESSFALRWPLWYVASKLSWDASQSAEEILRDACDKLYGEASEEMYKYYALLADISEGCTAYSNAWVPPTVRQMYYNNTAAINALFVKIEGKYDKLTQQQIERIENQRAYWENVLKYTK